MADVNTNEVVVEHNGDTFNFRVPSLRDEARTAAYIQGLIMSDTDNPVVKESSLDEMAQLGYRTLALFQLQLLKSSARWAFRENPQTKAPEPDLDHLPPDSSVIYMKYITEVNKFFQAGAANRNAPSQPTVAGESSSESKPV